MASKHLLVVDSRLRGSWVAIEDGEDRVIATADDGRKVRLLRAQVRTAEGDPYPVLASPTSCASWIQGCYDILMSGLVEVEPEPTGAAAGRSEDGGAMMAQTDDAEEVDHGHDDTDGHGDLARRSDGRDEGQGLVG